LRIRKAPRKLSRSADGWTRRENDFGGAQAFQFGEQRGVVFQFGGQEIAGGQVHQRQAEDFSRRDNGGEKIVPLGHEHALVEMRAGGEDLGDLALDELAGPGFLELLADGDLATGFEDAGDVIVGGVVRQAAHGDAVARGQRQVEQLRAGLGVLEKHLVKIPQPEQQQRILGQFALDAAILRHHGGELGFGGHAQPGVDGARCPRCGWSSATAWPLAEGNAFVRQPAHLFHAARRGRRAEPGLCRHDSAADLHAVSDDVRHHHARRSSAARWPNASNSRAMCCSCCCG
jgi:hypothetical protein